MRYLSLACWIGIVGCLGFAPSSARAQNTNIPPGASGVVLVASGTDFNSVPQSLTGVLDQARIPLVVQEVFGGSANYVTDTSAQRNYRDKGLQLARRIKSLHTMAPGGKIYLVGYSEGAVVALAATENLPPGSVDRIILVTPTASCKYDLRHALVVAREGIDCFYSIDDNYLQLVGDLTGAPDENHVWPAGRVGFRTYIGSYEDARRYQGLRQHRWTQQMEEVVRTEGHFAYSRTRFMQYYLLPLFRQGHGQPSVPVSQRDVEP